MSPLLSFLRESQSRYLEYPYTFLASSSTQEVLIRKSLSKCLSPSDISIALSNFYIQTWGHFYYSIKYFHLLHLPSKQTPLSMCHTRLILCGLCHTFLWSTLRMYILNLIWGEFIPFLIKLQCFHLCSGSYIDC